eukprot:CAMPEP_0178913430 /NCGR_PEP_ID=MMETSP0786-20121207/10836_1 /TAXON_ID=186022 /ORGANISM="Thalassionema frauenfeldii, Strain CCMP 1798" /LENGTH=175 /DNA_ID=CAMNT_0020586167 /DNA_START=32 /DNA_END=559 /DNA_ORIENTATION=+
MTQPQYYISITGLTLKSALHFPKFAFYTMPVWKQAKAANGNHFADGNYAHGILFTLTVWDNRRAMTRFMASGAHAKAMKIVNDVAIREQTKIYGYESDKIPTWEEAIEIWNANAKPHGYGVTKTRKSTTNETTSVITKRRTSSDVLNHAEMVGQIAAFALVPVVAILCYRLFPFL